MPRRAYNSEIGVDGLYNRCADSLILAIHIGCPSYSQKCKGQYSRDIMRRDSRCHDKHAVEGGDIANGRRVSTWRTSTLSQHRFNAISLGRRHFGRPCFCLSHLVRANHEGAAYIKQWAFFVDLLA